MIEKHKKPLMNLFIILKVTKNNFMFYFIYFNKKMSIVNGSQNWHNTLYTL